MRSARLRRTMPAAAGVVGAMALLAATGCQGPAGAAGTVAVAVTTTATPAPAPAPATVTIAPADASTAVLPSTPVRVLVAGGTLEWVRIGDGSGAQVPGRASATAWTSTGGLRPAAKYTVTAAARGVDGTVTTTTSSFTTLTPEVTATYGILHDGMTVGVGMPVSIQFDSAVTAAAMRAEVERRVSVTTTPRQAGSWGWLDDRQLMWRPVRYFRPGTRVQVRANLTGVQTGPGKWVGNDDQASFTVGSAMVSTVDMRAHTMTVRRDGAVLRVIPVSTGRPGPLTETRYGTKVVIAKEGTVTMDSATVGIPKGSPDYYRLQTQWNLRVTWTGEYLHSAPWSVGAQGSANVSHGCVNMSPADARWMYEHSKVGDVVTFTGSNRPFLPHEGIGVWMYDAAGWKARSALS